MKIHTKIYAWIIVGTTIVAQGAQGATDFGPWDGKLLMTAEATCCEQNPGDGGGGDRDRDKPDND